MSISVAPDLRIVVASDEVIYIRQKEIHGVSPRIVVDFGVTDVVWMNLYDEMRKGNARKSINLAFLCVLAILISLMFFPFGIIAGVRYFLF